MAKFISKSQMEELEDACTFGIEGANKLLKKYAGIQSIAYTEKRCFAIGISIRFLQLRRPEG